MDEYSGKVGKEDCWPSPPPYAFSGRIMLVSVVILFVALIIIALFHMYIRTARFLLRSSGFRLRRPHELPPNADVLASSSASTPHGLEPSVLKALSTFVYSSKTRDSSSLECAVCLSEFEDQETGRILPKCNHCFHVGCIDMWFRSHSNCPLCRAPVQNPDGTVLLVVQVSMPETDPSSGSCPNDQSVQDQMGCSNSSVPIVLSSLVEDRKLPEVTINVDPQPQVTRGDQGTSSPSNQNGGPGV